MKFDREEIQKMVLGGLLLLGLLYSYFFVFLASLNHSEDGLRTQLEGIQPQISAADKELLAFKDLKAKEPAATRTLDAVRALIPAGAPVAWFPPRMAEFMKRHGVDKCSTRLANELPEQNLHGYKRLSWTIELPQVEFIPFSIAIAGLENEEPLLEITNVQVEATRNNPQFQRVLLTVSNIVLE
jgi:hypothetical protein